MARIDRDVVQRWLDAYVHAWRTYDPAEIGALFSEDAVYYYGPYDDPVEGREAIVQSWVEEDQRDPPGTYDAHYAPLVIEGNTAITNGRSRYFEADGTTFKKEFDNIYLIRFNDNGECVEFREWYMQKPKAQ